MHPFKWYTQSDGDSCILNPFVYVFTCKVWKKGGRSLSSVWVWSLLLSSWFIVQTTAIPNLAIQKTHRVVTHIYRRNKQALLDVILNRDRAAFIMLAERRSHASLLLLRASSSRVYIILWLQPNARHVKSCQFTFRAGMMATSDMTDVVSFVWDMDSVQSFNGQVYTVNSSTDFAEPQSSVCLCICTLALFFSLKKSSDLLKTGTTAQIRGGGVKQHIIKTEKYAVSLTMMPKV